MARKVEAMPGDGRGGQSKYPWAEWLNGEVWELIQGEDFTVATTSMKTMALQAAQRAGGTATIRLRGTHVYVQAHRNGQADGVPD